MLTQADSTATVSAQSLAVTRPHDDTRTQNIRVALEERLGELREEYDRAMAEIMAQDRGLMLIEGGDDVADIGTKTFAREQELSLAQGILERIGQVERALDRLAVGGYGRCESCDQPIPPARLAAFPSATLCVGCKQRQERY